jgi:hypothetical protein
MDMSLKTSSARILALATKGSGTNEEDRLRLLLSGVDAEFVAFDKKAKKQSFLKVLATVFRERPDLLVMEGSGLAGGLVCLLARLLGRTRYVVSSGDAIGPFVGAHIALAGPIFALYERLLCRFSDGYIGWTPYLTGRAMTFGAPRGVTACGFAPMPLSRTLSATDAGSEMRPATGSSTVEPSSLENFRDQRPEWLEKTDAAIARDAVRSQLGIPESAIVFGIAGALVWNPRRRYCYGQELVEAICKRPPRPDLCVLIVGGGTGLEMLKKMAADRIAKTVFFTDQVPGLEVSKYLAAMDVASLPQSRDGVGLFRYTTKISEYAASGLPIVTGRLPLAYDLDDGSMWRLPGHAPWSPEYVAALSDLMDSLSKEDLSIAKAKVNCIRPEFDPQRQVDRITSFINDMLGELPRSATRASDTVQQRGTSKIAAVATSPAWAGGPGHKTLPGSPSGGASQ